MPGQFPYYNPNDPYGWNGANPQTQPDPTNVGWIYGEQNPESSFTRRLNDLGYGGTDPKSMFMRSQYGRAHEGYGAAKQTNLNLQWQDYLKNLDFERIYQNQSPNLKGFNDQSFAPPVRWQQRA